MIVALLALALAADQTPAPAPVKEKKICRRTAVTGSLMGNTVCHSKAEWAAIDSANAENTSRALELNDRSTRNTGL